MHLSQSAPKRSGGRTATAIATKTTIGVYTREKRVMKRSIFGLLATAFSTESRIRVTMDSARTFSTWMRMVPVILTQPESTGSPTAARTGFGSPVTAEVSIWVSPSEMMPSSGMRSPGRMRRISPTSASSAGMVSVPLAVTRWTTSGRRSTASMIWSRLRSAARSWKYSPMR